MFGMDNLISKLMSSKLEETLAVIRQVMEQFQDAVRSSSHSSNLTTFVCVYIPKFLSLYGMISAKINQMAHRRAFDHRQSSSLSVGKRNARRLSTMRAANASAAEVHGTDRRSRRSARRDEHQLVLATPAQTIQIMTVHSLLFHAVLFRSRAEINTRTRRSRTSVPQERGEREYAEQCSACTENERMSFSFRK